MEKTSILRLTFFQDIYRSADKKLVLNGKIVGTAINEQGRPSMPDALDAILTAQNAQMSVAV